MRLAPWAVLAMLTAGCTQAAPAPGPSEPPPEQWGGLEFAVSQPGGYWAAFKERFPEPVGSFSFEYRWVASSAAGDSLAVVQVGPFATIEDIQMPITSPTFHLEKGGGEIRGQANGSFEPPINGRRIEGVYFGIMTTGDLELSLTITVHPEGNKTVPAALAQGTQVHFFEGANLAQSPVDGAGRLLIERTLEHPGWTHVQIQEGGPGEVGVEDYDIRLPNGFVVSASSAQAVAPMAPVGARLFPFEYAGSFADTAGDLHVEVAYAETVTEMDVFALHGDAGPDSGTWSHEVANYSGNSAPV